MERSKGFAGLQADMGRLVESLTKINTDFLAPRDEGWTCWRHRPPFNRR